MSDVCTKMPHTQEEAFEQATIDSMYFRRTLRAYYCKKCKSWHIGGKRKSREDNTARD